MIRTDRICVWLFILNTVLMMVSQKYIGFIDELICWGMFGVAMVDCVFNRRWKNYMFLWTVIGILTFYLVFTLSFRNYNTPRYVLIDYIMFIKPFLPLCGFMGMRVSLTPCERTVLKWAALFNAFLSLVCVAIGVELAQDLLLGHILVQGQACMTAAIIYIVCASDENGGTLTRRDILIVLVILLIGLYCQRSKYYGEFVIMLFMLFVYRPGILSSLSFRNLMLLLGVGALILVLIWDKLYYYYIEPDFSTDVMGDNMARMALMYGMFVVITEYPLFGGGLASFGTFPSAWNYSDLYREIGIDVVWGISPTKYNFIADNFIATLGGQFGLVGFVLFIWMLVYLYRKLAPFRTVDYPLYRYQLIAGIMIIVDIIIENTSGNLLFLPCGVSQLSVLGLLIGRACILRDETRHPLYPESEFSSGPVESVSSPSAQFPQFQS